MKAVPMRIDLERTRKSARRVAKFLEKNPKTPSADVIHKLRASARHLESTFVALGLDSRRTKRPLPDLGEIRKLAGKIRDMDIGTANALTLQLRGEQDCLVRLLEHLGARRRNRAKKLRRLVRAARPRLRRDVKRSVRRAAKLLEPSKTDKAKNDAVAAATSRAIRFSSELRHAGRLTKKNLHEYRLKLKEFRDVLRLSDRPGSSDLLKHLGEVKDSIGDWHDWVELAAIAEPVLDHGTRCKLMKRLRETADSKYERAVSLAKGFARRYLEPRNRRRGPSAALEAASAIAEP